MDISAIKSALTPGYMGSADLPSHVHACCAFLSPWLEVSAVSETDISGGTYRDVAAKGFALALDVGKDDLKASFFEGVQRLSGRTFFVPGRAPTFEVDGVALLGVAMGYVAANASQADHSWLRTCLDQSVGALRDDPWQRSLARAAQSALGVTIEPSGIDPILQVALSRRTANAVDDGLRQKAWASLVHDVDESDPTRRAALQGTFEVCAAALARLPIHGAGIVELVEILEGVSRSMGHWTYESKPKVQGVPPQKWEIDHEYHVQNLLWTVLRPVFPDLVDEETLKKIGHTSPRYDLGVPSLSTIIEVKYLRKRGQTALKKITDEVAADHSLYLRDGTGFTRMIAFIWDEERQTEEYQTLKAGLESLEGIERVIIAPRPAKMERAAGKGR